MGTVESKTERNELGEKVDPYRAPDCSDTSDTRISKTACSVICTNKINNAMSKVKVSTRESAALQKKFQNELFSKWNENFEVRQYRGYSIGQEEMLLENIRRNLGMNDQTIYKKMRAIFFAEEVGVQIYEFNFNNHLNSEKVRFGMVAVSKAYNCVEAISCMYTLEFSLAQVLVKVRRVEKLLGMTIRVTEETRYEKRNLGFITGSSLENFCRVKALKEIKKQNLVSSINDVDTLEPT